jgi:hypothetical protein
MTSQTRLPSTTAENNQELAHLPQNKQDSLPTAQKLAPRARQTRRSSGGSKPINQKVTGWSENEAAPVLATPAESVPHKPYSSAYGPKCKTAVILSFAVKLKPLPVLSVDATIDLTSSSVTLQEGGHPFFGWTNALFSEWRFAHVTAKPASNSSFPVRN